MKTDRPGPGDQIRDNDRRKDDRVLTITRVGDGRVYAVDDKGREYRYFTSRIHTDGKPRNYGFSLLPVHPCGKCIWAGYNGDRFGCLITGEIVKERCEKYVEK